MMLHTKFHGHWSIGSGEEDFLRFLPYMGMAAMLVMWPRSFEQFFFPKVPGGCIWNLVAIRPVVSEEKSFEIVDGRRTDDGRTTDNGACLYYKLPRSLRLRWAKNLLLQNQLTDDLETWYVVPKFNLHLWIDITQTVKQCYSIFFNIFGYNLGCPNFQD